MKKKKDERESFNNARLGNSRDLMLDCDLRRRPTQANQHAPPGRVETLDETSKSEAIKERLVKERLNKVEERVKERE